MEENEQVLDGDNSLTRFSNTVQSTTQLPVYAGHSAAAGMGQVDVVGLFRLLLLCIHLGHPVCHFLVIPTCKKPVFCM